MSEKEEIDPEIRDLMQEKAAEHEVPLEILVEIYREERRVVNMDLRQDIHTNIRSHLTDYAENWELPDRG